MYCPVPPSRQQSDKSTCNTSHTTTTTTTTTTSRTLPEDGPYGHVLRRNARQQRLEYTAARAALAKGCVCEGDPFGWVRQRHSVVVDEEGCPLTEEEAAGQARRQHAREAEKQRILARLQAEREARWRRTEDAPEPYTPPSPSKRYDTVGVVEARCAEITARRKEKEEKVASERREAEKQHLRDILERYQHRAEEENVALVESTRRRLRAVRERWAGGETAAEVAVVDANSVRHQEEEKAALVSSRAHYKQEALAWNRSFANDMSTVRAEQARKREARRIQTALEAMPQHIRHIVSGSLQV